MDPVRLHAFGCRWSWRLPSRAELRISSTVYAAACSRDVCARHPLNVQVVCRNSYRFPAAPRRPVGCGWRPGLAVRWVRSAARALTYNCVAMYHLKRNKQITCTLDCVVCADLRATRAARATGTAAALEPVPLVDASRTKQTPPLLLICMEDAENPRFRF